MDTERVAVVGAGLMGHGIAQVFAVNGHAVAIHDPFPDVLARVPERVRANLRTLGLSETAAERISLHSTLEDAVKQADKQTLTLLVKRGNAKLFIVIPK